MALRRPEDFHHEHVQLADVRLHYVREGSGAPLVLLHGWPGFWWEWHRSIGPLAESFDVIAPDMRGYGDSEKPDFSRIELYHLDRVVEDTAQLLDHLGIKQAFLVGHDDSALVLHKFVRLRHGRYEHRLRRHLW